MTRRRKDEGFFDDLYDTLLVVPAWVGPPLALLFFLVLRFLIPAIFGGSEKPDIGTVVAGLAKGVALPVAGLVLIIWLLAEFKKWWRRRLLDAQSGLNSIRDLSWQEFEHLVGEAYRRQGYVLQETGSASGDGGIDVLLTKGDERVLVQCKQWRTRRVGVKPIRELYGVMMSEKAAKAILVTCGSFTGEARRFAEGKPVELLDGADLWELVREVRARKQVEETPSPPTESLGRDASPGTPTCPICGSTMALRTARRGQHAGSQFWGCSRFPGCRGTRNFERGGTCINGQ